MTAAGSDGQQPDDAVSVVGRPVDPVVAHLAARGFFDPCDSCGGLNGYHFDDCELR